MRTILIVILMMVCVGCTTSSPKWEIVDTNHFPPFLLNNQTGQVWYTTPSAPYWIPVPKAEILPDDPTKMRVLPPEQVK